VTKDGYNGEDTLYSFCNDVLLGFAAMRGSGMDEDPKAFSFLGWSTRFGRRDWRTG
jgi:hypothetical protein